jgi:hypothetical protein
MSSEVNSFHFTPSLSKILLIYSPSDFAEFGLIFNLQFMAKQNYIKNYSLPVEFAKNVVPSTASRMFLDMPSFKFRCAELLERIVDYTPVGGRTVTYLLLLELIFYFRTLLLYIISIFNGIIIIITFRRGPVLRERICGLCTRIFYLLHVFYLFPISYFIA